MTNPNVHVERLDIYNPADVVGIGRLMPFLSGSLDDRPIAEQALRHIIDSPWHDQLVARLDGIIVGAATMSVVMNAGTGPEGHLGDLVVDPAVRGQGIGDALWQHIIAWCKERGVDLDFTSHPSRADAHRFYLKHGAERRSTDVFHVHVKNMII